MPRGTCVIRREIPEEGAAAKARLWSKPVEYRDTFTVSGLSVGSRVPRGIRWLLAEAWGLWGRAILYSGTKILFNRCLTFPSFSPVGRLNCSRSPTPPVRLKQGLRSSSSVSRKFKPQRRINKFVKVLLLVASEISKGSHVTVCPFY